MPEHVNVQSPEFSLYVTVAFLALHRACVFLCDGLALAVVV